MVKMLSTKALRSFDRFVDHSSISDILVLRPSGITP